METKACVTDPTAVFTINLYTVQVADLAFQAPFKMIARRSDFIHALIAWFDIEFTACHKAVRFSTGPHAKYTHWKQTVFYLREVVTVSEDEVVRGMLKCRPNSKKPRDLDIEIEYELETEDPSRASKGSCTYKM